MYKGFADILKRVYNGQLKAGDIDRGLHWEQFKALFKGVENGLGLDWKDVAYDTPDGRMLEILRENVFVFSACKNYQELKAISAELIDENGKVREFEDFKKKALAIHEEYNKTWLQAEYNHAIASSQMAGKWNRIYADKDLFPYLRFNAVVDGRTTDTCKGLDGVTKHIDDPIWNTYYPPNHWGCRSDVDQVENAKETPTDKIKFPDVPDMFRTNVGKKGVAFPDKHPYYNISKKDAPKLAETIHKLKIEVGIYTPAKNIKEAEAFALNSGLARKVSYRGMHIDYANAVNRTLYDLKKETGKTYDFIEAKALRGKSGLTTAMQNVYYISSKEQALRINTNYIKQFKNIDALNESAKLTKERGWWMPENYEGFVKHEFGHRLTVNKAYQEPKFIQNKGFAGISTYGETNLKETLAEIFTKYKQEGKDSLKPIYIDLFNKYSEFKI